MSIIVAAAQSVSSPGDIKRNVAHTQDWLDRMEVTPGRVNMKFSAITGPD